MSTNINKPQPAGESKDCITQSNQTQNFKILNKLRNIPVVYYFFSYTGKLLYIGTSVRFPTRWDGHKESDKELSQVFKVIIAEYRTESEAAFMELNHICKYKPMWNHHGLDGGVSDIVIAPVNMYLRIKDDAEGVISFDLHSNERKPYFQTYKSVNKLGYPGVHKTPQNKYVAKCYNKGKRINLGTFDNPIDAAEAYATYKAKVFQEYLQSNI